MRRSLFRGAFADEKVVFAVQERIVDRKRFRSGRDAPVIIRA